MVENQLRDFLVQNVNALTNSNCFVGELPQTPASGTNVLIVSSNSPLSDSHNSLAMKLSTPKGIGEKSVALTIISQSSVYDNASDLIWEIYAALGSDDGGCITLSGQDPKQIHITPAEAPFYEDGVGFKLNFVVRTRA